MPVIYIYNYNKDGRLSYKELNNSFNRLISDGWKREIIYKIRGKDYKNHTVNLTCYAYISPDLSKKKPSKAFWILSGIHGEEPAGPNALAKEVDLLLKLVRKGVPIVLIPLLNPLGYIKDYRYFDLKRHKKDKPARSVTDAEHMLPHTKNPNLPRSQKASNRYARQVMDWFDKHIGRYPPLLVFDHHEDEIDHTETENINSGFTYSYCYGKPKDTKEVSKLITDLLIKKGFPIQKTGTTWFGERIFEGFVSNSKDGSIDEFLSYRGAKACFVVETTRDDKKPIPLKDRVQIHREIIRNYLKIWSLLNRN